MKKVLVTATTFPRWKNDTEPDFVFKLCQLLAEKGHKIIVLVPHSHKSKKSETMGKLKIYRFPYFYPSKLQRLCYDGGVLENLKKSFLAKIQVPFLLISEYRHIIKITKKEKIDFIHAHWIVPQGFIAALIKKTCKLPFISTAHAADVFTPKNYITKMFARFAVKNSSYVTSNSSFTKSSILQICRNAQVNVIPMGVDLSSFNPKKKNTSLKKQLGIKNKFILFVGRLVEKKGVEYLIKSMPIILSKMPKSKLVIIGDGPEKERLVNLTEELNLKSNVEFLGKLTNKDLPKFYASADVFVGPSIVTKNGDTEGLGVVFLEAIASGTCVLGSNVGGIPDIIKHKKTGILVEQKDHVALASAIINLLKNKKLQVQLAKNAISHIKNSYSWNTVAEKFDEIYRNMK
ncbi:glycosyltransferase family 4 protein [Candidatus Woesearchaeota archaeon]|nr:glycosyltransferase family 4 protein [Candidatus Woesearchaeota archaeon]